MTLEQSDATSAIEEAERIIRGDIRAPSIEAFSADALAAIRGDRTLRTSSSTGESINDLRDARFLIKFIGNSDDSVVESEPSLRTQLAVIKNDIFLPRSSYLTFDQQLEMLAELDISTRARIPGVKVILSRIATYTTLICRDTAFYDIMDPRPKGIRSTTKLGQDGITIDSASLEHGIHIAKRPLQEKSMGLYIVPLIVPESLKIG